MPDSPADSRNVSAPNSQPHSSGTPERRNAARSGEGNSSARANQSRRRRPQRNDRTRTTEREERGDRSNRNGERTPSGDTGARKSNNRNRRPRNRRGGRGRHAEEENLNLQGLQQAPADTLSPSGRATRQGGHLPPRTLSPDRSEEGSHAAADNRSTPTTPPVSGERKSRSGSVERESGEKRERKARNERPRNRRRLPETYEEAAKLNERLEQEILNEIEGIAEICLDD